MTPRQSFIWMAAVLLVIAGVGAAFADGLGADEPLQYDQRYQCNGERVVVSHCGGEGDSALCQVVYLDRPNGPTRDRFEQRGDVIKKLRACGAPPPPKAAALPPAPPAPPPARPAPAVRAFGPELCPTITRLISLTHEDFRSIDGGPNRAMSDPQQSHLSSLVIPGAQACSIEHDPGDPVMFACLWPQSKDARDHFLDLFEVLANCTGHKPDLKMLKHPYEPDVTITSQGVDLRAVVLEDTLVLDVKRAHAAKPASTAMRARTPSPAKKR